MKNLTRSERRFKASLPGWHFHIGFADSELPIFSLCDIKFIEDFKKNVPSKLHVKLLKMCFYKFFVKLVVQMKNVNDDEELFIPNTHSIGTSV